MLACLCSARVACSCRGKAQAVLNFPVELPDVWLRTQVSQQPAGGCSGVDQEASAASSLTAPYMIWFCLARGAAGSSHLGSCQQLPGTSLHLSRLGRPWCMALYRENDALPSLSPLP